MCVFYVQVQYGIFPDDYTINLLINSYIKDGDFKSNFSYGCVQSGIETKHSECILQKISPKKIHFFLFIIKRLE